MRSTIGPVRWFLSAVLCLWLAGCGSKYDLAFVKGQVTVGGQPVEGLLVQFQPVGEGGSPSAGITDAKGRYRLMYTFNTPGVEPGEHLVTIRCAAAYYEEDCAKENSTQPSAVTCRINVQRRVTVEPGSQTIDFDL